MNAKDIIKNGLIKENPTWVLILGMCPTLATTTSAINSNILKDRKSKEYPHE